MNSMNIVRDTLNRCDRATLGLLEDMRDAPLTQPTSNGGNHPYWVLGHLTLVEGRLRQMILGEKSEVENLAPLFEPGSQPRNDGAGYPPYDELLGTYRRLRTRNMELLDKLGESGLAQPLKAAPRGMESFLRTAGDAFMTIAIHQMNHRGQVADARRAAGRAPLFTPGAPVATAAAAAG
jgi:hypothetical protein